jgi:hypothetical protein
MQVIGVLSIPENIQNINIQNMRELWWLFVVKRAYNQTIFYVNLSGCERMYGVLVLYVPENNLNNINHKLNKKCFVV